MTELRYAFFRLAVLARLAGVLALALARASTALFPTRVVSEHVLVALRLGLMTETVIAGRGTFVHDLQQTKGSVIFGYYTR